MRHMVSQRMEREHAASVRFAAMACLLCFAFGAFAQGTLEETAEIHAVAVWRNYDAKRVYFCVIVQLSNDSEFEEGVHTLYNNDLDNEAGLGAGKDKLYVETHKGRLIPAGGACARYVRLYTKGNSNSANNHYIEVEVFGKPQGG